MEILSEKEIAQKDWDELYEWLLQQKQRSSTIDLEATFVDKGFSRHCKYINFSKKSINSMQFQNFIFDNCNFSSLDIRNTSFSNVKAHNCQFSNTKWIKSALRDCMFLECDFSLTEFINSEIASTSFQLSNFLASSWNTSKVASLNIEDSNLNESTFQNVFMKENIVSRSTLVDSIFINNAGEFHLRECAPSRTGQPVIAMPWDFLQRGIYSPYIDQALRDNGGVVLKIAMEPDSIDLAKLNAEVIKIIVECNQLDTIALEIINRANSGSEIQKICSYAFALLEHCNGLVLPGGKDIEPELYKAKKNRNEPYDFRRSVLEIALISYAYKIKVPTMGICRGSQMINVFFGGTLLQDVEKQNEAWQHLKLLNSSKKESFLHWIGKEYLLALSMHHQACDQMANNLEVVMQFDTIPKLFISHDDLFLGVQFHPEVYLICEDFGSGFEEAERNKGIYQFFFSKIALHTKVNIYLPAD